MKLFIISNNYGKSYDGVGAYAEAVASQFPKDIECKVFTDYRRGTDLKITKLFSFGMTRAMLRAIKEMESERPESVLIEYPFVEWNPLIVPVAQKLRRVANSINAKIFISLCS